MATGHSGNKEHERETSHLILEQNSATVSDGFAPLSKSPYSKACIDHDLVVECRYRCEYKPTANARLQSRIDVIMSLVGTNDIAEDSSQLNTSRGSLKRLADIRMTFIRMPSRNV